MGLLLSRAIMSILAIGALLFGVRTAWVAFRSPINHPYWWAFVSLLGTPVTTLTWGTGAIDTRILTVQFPILGFTFGGPDIPTLLAIGFPVGALVFRQRRRSLIARRYPARPENQLPG